MPSVSTTHDEPQEVEAAGNSYMHLGRTKKQHVNYPYSWHALKSYQGSTESWNVSVAERGNGSPQKCDLFYKIQ